MNHVFQRRQGFLCTVIFNPTHDCDLCLEQLSDTYSDLKAGQGRKIPDKASSLSRIIQQTSQNQRFTSEQNGFPDDESKARKRITKKLQKLTQFPTE